MQMNHISGIFLFFLFFDLLVYQLIERLIRHRLDHGTLPELQIGLMTTEHIYADSSMVRPSFELCSTVSIIVKTSRASSGLTGTSPWPCRALANIL